MQLSVPQKDVNPRPRFRFETQQFLYFNAKAESNPGMRSVLSTPNAQCLTVIVFPLACLIHGYLIETGGH